MNALSQIPVSFLRFELLTAVSIKFAVFWDVKSRDSAVGIATGYGAGIPIVRSSILAGGKNFFFSMSFRPALGPTQPPNQRVPGALSPGVKRPGREADH
jgi:hypothetical protein